MKWAGLSNTHLRISDLVAELERVKAAHGDLPLYVYGTDERRFMPMTAESLKQISPVASRLVGCAQPIGLGFTAILPWVEEQLILSHKGEMSPAEHESGGDQGHGNRGEN